MLHRASMAFFVVVLVVGLGLIAYPTVSDWWNRLHQSYAIASYEGTTNDLGAEKREAMWRAAEQYNAALAANGDRWHLTDEQQRIYETTLDVTGTGIMGYLSIPEIDVQLPVYHDVSDGVLGIAVGHLPGSSLPVGGAGTHAVISGHTGLPSAGLLTRLDDMNEGDTFSLHVLDRVLTYQVDRISVVEPDDISGLDIEPGEDLVTLVTCTPYGVNSHRLLVRGHRVPTPASEDKSGQAGSPSHVLAIGIGVGSAVIAAALTVTIILARRCRLRHRARHSAGCHG